MQVLEHFLNATLSFIIHGLLGFFTIPDLAS